MLQLMRGPRGRGLAVRRDVREGEVLLDEAPLLLYVDDDACDDYCSHCLRCLSPAGAPAAAPPASPLRCPHCRVCSFCSQACLDQSQAATQTPSLCRALSRLPPRSSTSAAGGDPASGAGGEGEPLTGEDRTAVRFLLAAYDLLLRPRALPPLAEAVWGEELAERVGGRVAKAGGGEEAEERECGRGRKCLDGRVARNDCFALLLALDGGDGEKGGSGGDENKGGVRGEAGKQETNEACVAPGGDAASVGASSSGEKEAVSVVTSRTEEGGEARLRAERLHAVVLRATHDWPWPAGRETGSAVGSEAASEAAASRGDVTAALLSRDARNSFAVMAPFTPGGERGVRGYTVFPAASLANHSCYPNACRFDYFDSPPPATVTPDSTIAATSSSVPFSSNTHLQLRAMRDLQQGEEVFLSYFPLGWRLGERRERVREDYGFECECERCVLEESMGGDESDGEEGEEEEGEEGEEVEDGEEGEEVEGETKLVDDGQASEEEGRLEEGEAGSEEGVEKGIQKGKGAVASGLGKGAVDAKGKGKAAQTCDDDADEEEVDGNDSDEDGDGGSADVSDAELAHALFFMKHLCAVEGCGGTMAARPGRWLDGRVGEVGAEYEVADDMECNMCGVLQSRHDLLSALCSH